MRVAIAIAALAATVVAACTPGSDGATGTASIGSPGVIVNSPLAAGAGEEPLGVVEGGLTGAEVGRSLTDRDRAIALRAEYEALEYGRAGPATTWQSPTTGNRGDIVVGATYQVNRLDCREYKHTVYIGARARVVHGTACRQPDSAWRIVG